VLKRVTTNDNVGLEMLVLLGKEVGDELYRIAPSRTPGVHSIPRIDAQPRRTASATKLAKKFAFATPDLKDMLADDRTLLGGLSRQLFSKSIERAGKVLRLLEISRVTHYRFVEDMVENKAAPVAIGEFQITSREGASFLSTVQENAAMNRNRR
jgi:hypothetical protein